MNICKDYKLHEVADRYAGPLNVVRVGRDGLAVATNGRALACVPVLLIDGEIAADQADERLVPASLFKHASKYAKPKFSHFELNGAATASNGKEEMTAPYSDVTFPDGWKDILDRARKESDHHRVALNPSLLLSLAKALGGADRVVLSFPKGHSPILVETRDGAIGAIMPMKE